MCIYIYIRIYILVLLPPTGSFSTASDITGGKKEKFKQIK